MRIDHRGRDILVTEEFLDGPDIVAVLRSMGCKRVPGGEASGGRRGGWLLVPRSQVMLSGSAPSCLARLPSPDRVTKGSECLKAFHPLATGGQVIITMPWGTRIPW